MPKPPTRTAPQARVAEVQLPTLDDSHAWPGHFVQVGTVRVHVRSTPSGNPAAEPALFVHGLGGSAHNWTDLATLLRDRLAIDSIDLLGHGRTTAAPDRNYSLQANADLVIRYLEQTGRGPVHLAGNSMGGAISILVAAQRPDLIRTLTLVSPAVADNRVRLFALRNDWRMGVLAVPAVGERFLESFSKRTAVETRVAGTIALCFADKSRYPKQRMDEAIAESTVRLDMPWAASAFARSLRALVRSQLAHRRAEWVTMQRITAPTLVIWGDVDRLVPPDLAPYVASAIPDARLLILTDIGHTAMMEDPPTTARAMIALFDDAAGGGS